MKRARPAYMKTSGYKSKVKKTNTTQAMAVYKQPTNPIRFVRRNADYGPLSVTNLTGASFAFSFRLSNVPNSAELTSLYDQYKISAINLRFYPKMTQITSTSNANSIDNVRILTAIDYNDATAPTSIDVIREYENCECHSVLETFDVYIDKPRILDSSSSSRTSWIATSSPGTLHYGLKGWVEPVQYTAGSFGYQIEAIFYLAFKNIK